MVAGKEGIGGEVSAATAMVVVAINMAVTKTPRGRVKTGMSVFLPFLLPRPLRDEVCCSAAVIMPRESHPE